MILFIKFPFHIAQGWLSLFIHDHHGSPLILLSVIKNIKPSKAPVLHNLLETNYI